MTSDLSERSSSQAIDKQGKNRQKTNQPQPLDAPYVFKRYQEMALDFSIGIALHIDKGRYTYPARRPATKNSVPIGDEKDCTEAEDFELVEDEKDYLFHEDNGPYWKSSGRQPTGSEWSAIFEGGK